MAKAKEVSKFRQLVAEKLMDLGNLVVTGLVIGQLVSGMEISIPLMIGGLSIGLFCYIISYIITRK